MASEAHDLEYFEPSSTAVSEAGPKSRAARRRPSLRAVEQRTPPADRWIDEVLDLPAHLIGDLPVGVTFRMQAVDGSIFHVSSSEADGAQLRAAGEIVLDREEWSALVLATEADRAWPADLVRALGGRGVSGRFSADVLLDGISVEQARLDAGRLFSVGRVLERLGARLDGVHVELAPIVEAGVDVDALDELAHWDLAS